jgi:hypothetical protein
MRTIEQRRRGRKSRKRAAKKVRARAKPRAKPRAKYPPVVEQQVVTSST